MIASTANAKIKQLVQWQTKAKERRRDGVFVAEGMKMFLEAPERLIRESYLSEELEDRLRRAENERDSLVYEKLKRTGYETVTGDVMRRAADTQTPQGILSVVEQPAYGLEELLEADGLYLILENLQDPGNLGTIFRTGEGAGVNGIIMTRETVDLFNPKTIRSTMGSVFRVPFVYVETLSPVLDRMKKLGIATYAAHLRGTDFYDAFSYRKGTAFMIGNEGNGLTKEAAGGAEHYLKIPMEGELESLNAAVSAAILMYEAHRQRAAGKP